eukprot:GHRR01003277.1.p1 GENE.GHRR01003277.1~~GHRR01003277.1.p1  ORF type:complete len:252 (+),score=33.78 GHRR01003277.1:1011-1766(+)
MSIMRLGAVEQLYHVLFANVVVRGVQPATMRPHCLNCVLLLSPVWQLFCTVLVRQPTAFATPQLLHLVGLWGVYPLSLLFVGAAWAGTSKIGEFEASGFLFKDAVEVNAFDDPAVPGVTIYFSDFKRSLVDKLAKDFFTDPSQTSLTCSISEDAHVADPRALASSEGKEIFSERKGLSIFKDKTLRVRRLYDPSRQTLVYVAYSTRLSSAADEGKVSSGRYRTSICALKLPSPAAKAPAVTDAVSAAAALN